MPSINIIFLYEEHLCYAALDDLILKYYQRMTGTNEESAIISLLSAWISSIIGIEVSSSIHLICKPDQLFGDKDRTYYMVIDSSLHRIYMRQEDKIIDKEDYETMRKSFIQHLNRLSGSNIWDGTDYYADEIDYERACYCKECQCPYFDKLCQCTECLYDQPDADKMKSCRCCEECCWGWVDCHCEECQCEIGFPDSRVRIRDDYRYRDEDPKKNLKNILWYYHPEKGQECDHRAQQEDYISNNAISRLYKTEYVSDEYNQQRIKETEERIQFLEKACYDSRKDPTTQEWYLAKLGTQYCRLYKYLYPNVLPYNLTVTAYVSLKSVEDESSSNTKRAIEILGKDCHIRYVFNTEYVDCDDEYYECSRKEDYYQLLDVPFGKPTVDHFIRWMTYEKSVFHK